MSWPARSGVLELRAGRCPRSRGRPWTSGSPASDAGDGVAPHLLLDRHRLPAGLAELAEGCGTRRHSWQPTRPRRGSRRAVACARSWTCRDLAAASPTTGLRRHSRPDLDDSGWEPVAVPGHWRIDAAFADSRRAAALPPPLRRPTARPTGERAWLVLRRPLLPGRRVARRRLLGDTEGYFFPHTFEVTDALRDRTEHLLAVEVDVRAASATARPSATSPASSSTGTASTPTGTPAASGARCASSETGPVRIRRLRVAVPRGRPPSRPSLRCPGRRSTATRRRHRRSSRTTRRRPATEHRGASRWPPARTSVEWTVTVARPAAVVAAGPRATSRSTTSTVEAVARGRRAVSHTRRAPHRPALGGASTTGSLSVNGERLFLKGANQGPTRMAARPRRPPTSCAGDVDLAKEAGLDLLRVHAHVSRPELYDAADEAGLLLWQDLPAAVGLRPRRPQAGRAPGPRGGRPARPPPVGRDLVRAQRAAGPRRRARPADRRPGRGRPAVTPRRPGAADLEQDGARPLGQAGPRDRPTAPGPVIAHSGVLPHLPARRHRHPPLLRLVPRRRARPARLRCRAVPRLVRFVVRVRRPGRARRRADFMRARALARPRLGAPGARTTACRRRSSTGTCRPAELRHLRRLAGGDPGVPGRRSIKHHVETLRRLKYRPTGGFASSASPTATRRSPGRCSTTSACPRPATRRWPRPAAR